MGQRMFVAVVPPERVREDLADFLEARPGQRWISPEQWHITLAFLADVPEHRTDELIERLGVKAAKRQPFSATLTGAGAFPHPARAQVLWLGVECPNGGDSLARLAASSRAAAAKVGAPPDGKRFTAHLSLARLRPPIEATKWLRVLDSYRSPSWMVESVDLVASYLGEGPAGRPRYETLATIPLRQSESADA